MGSLSCQQMRDLEARAFECGATPESLMDEAGEGIAKAIRRRYSEPGLVVACLGKGNNAGDALVALRHLAATGWKIAWRCPYEWEQLSPLTRKKREQLGDCEVFRAECGRLRSGPLVLLDGLLGLGASGELRSPLAEMADWINQQRREGGADVVSLDLPSGLCGDRGAPVKGTVVADLTLTVGAVKRGLLMPSAVPVLGCLELVPVKGLEMDDAESLEHEPGLSDVFSLRGLLARRPHDYHKGDAGHLGVLAGSVGMLGAAVLCARGALRAGAGLVSVMVYEDVYPLLAPMMPPEVMVRPIRSLNEIRRMQLDALVMGPGVGSANQHETRRWLGVLRGLEIPVLLDADGLNRLATVPLVKFLRPNHVLTPHPGEMRRLFPEGAHLDRLEKVRVFSERYPGTTLLLKGARSLVAQHGKPVQVNGSGHAGMACGGQGDVLSGVIGGLLAQGMMPFDATRLGAWLCGRAAEFAISDGCQSQQSLTAGDVAENLGMAFRELG